LWNRAAFPFSIPFPQALPHKDLTDVISRFSGRMSPLDSDWTICSSDKLATGMYTMKPRRSSSRESDLVRGECGEPARTMTSVLDPFFAFLARRLARSDVRRRQIMKAPVPTKAITAAVTARCSNSQSRDAS